MTQVYATTRTVLDLRRDDVYWCTADVGWVTGHSYVVYGPLAAGAAGRDLRRGAGLARQRSLLGDLRTVRRLGLLHRPHRDPGLHAVGRRVARRSRAGEHPAPGHGGRADQPRGVDVVSARNRRGSLPHRRHLVADRDGGDDDLAAPRSHPCASGKCVPPAPGDRCRSAERRRREREGWLPRDHPPVAIDAARNLGRPAAFSGDLLVEVGWGLFCRRWREVGRRRLPVGPGPGGTMS